MTLFDCCAASSNADQSMVVDEGDIDPDEAKKQERRAKRWSTPKAIIKCPLKMDSSSGESCVARLLREMAKVHATPIKLTRNKPPGNDEDGNPNPPDDYNAKLSNEIKLYVFLPLPVTCL